MMIASIGLANALDFTSPQRILLVLVALLGAGGTVELIRRRLLRESYAMLWLFISTSLVIFAAVPQLLFWISSGIGVEYYTIMMLVIFLILTSILLQYSIVLSKRADENRRIVQRLALLQQRLEELERSGELDQGSRPGIESESEEAGEVSDSEDDGPVRR